MALENQYGINLGNIMSTASNLKTAQLDLDTKEYMMSKQKELDVLAKEKSSNENIGKIATMISVLPVEQQPEAFQRSVEMLPSEAQEAVKKQGLTYKDIPFLINKSLTNDQVYDAYIKNPRDQKAKIALESMKLNSKAESTQREQNFKINLEQMKQEGRKDIELLKAQIPKQKDKGEFETIMGLLDNPNLPEEKRKRYDARLDKLTQGEMSSLLINANTVKEEQSALASDLGLDDPYKLASIDVTQLTPEQQARANQTASIIIKGLGANAKAAEKKMGEYGAMANQMQNAIDNYKEVGDFRAGDELTKKYFSNYFGLSDKEIKSTEAAQAFQSMANIKIKADSGSAVSGQEMVRNVLETASPFMDKKRILLGIKNVAERNKGELTALKTVMGPVAFNLKYGGVLKNYEDLSTAANDAAKGGASPSGKTLQDLRASKQPQQQQTQQKQVVRTGISNGRKVVQYSDGSVDYAD